ncbi:MAG: uroporphyrinogen decarboxylase family protein [Thermomicrobium sp.]|nr:uroporphyrinogen decarboxylase family protein [Thermomicrobium sp.]
MQHSEHWERVRGAIAGEPVDVPPVSLWRHFPHDDQRTESLAAATLAWQRRFAFDFVKLMPPGDYPVIAWGGASEYRGNHAGTRTVTRFPVQGIDDWHRIRPLSVECGPLRVVVETARLVREELGGTVPILQTIFSPLTTASKLSNGRVLRDLQEAPSSVEEALAAITETTRRLVRASLAAGADGIFFATQCATAEVTDVSMYKQWGRPWDLAVLEEAAGAPFVLLHLHGLRPHFDLLLDYPVHVVNWHDQRTALTLAHGHRRSGRCVAGGLDESTIAETSPEAVAAQARAAIEQLGGRHLMVTPGCVIPITTPDANVAAAVRAVRTSGAEQLQS